MIDLQIDVTSLEDIRHAGSDAMRQSISTTALSILRRGGRVVLKRSYLNSPDELYRVYKNDTAFEKDWNAFFNL